MTKPVIYMSLSLPSLPPTLPPSLPPLPSPPSLPPSLPPLPPSLPPSLPPFHSPSQKDTLSQILHELHELKRSYATLAGSLLIVRRNQDDIKTRLTEIGISVSLSLCVHSHTPQAFSLHKCDSTTFEPGNINHM